MKKLNVSYLAITLLGLMTSSIAMAQSQNDENLPTLDEIQAQIEKQGTKISNDVITEKVKDKSTATDLRGLLKDEPAIEISGGNGTSQFFTIRGMGQNFIDVNIDNAYSDSPMYYQQGRFMLDPALVKVVEIQKGTGSASTGLGTINGTIVAKTVDALDLLKNSNKDYGVKISGGYNSNDGINYGAAAFGKSGNFDALFAYHKIDDNDYKAGEGFELNGGNTVTYSALDKESYLAKIGASLGNHRVVFSHMQEKHAGENVVDEDKLLKQKNLPLLPSIIQNQGLAHREMSLSNTNLQWSATQLGPIEKARANVYQIQNKRFSADDYGTGISGGIKGPTTAKITTKGANAHVDLLAGKYTVLKTGINYRNQEVSPSHFAANVGKAEKTDTSVYVEAISNIGDVTLAGGVRYDHFKYKAMDNKTSSHGQLSPSLSATWQVSNNLSLNASHNHATRSPHLYDALLSHGYDDVGLDGIVTSIADYITAQHARTTEIGFNFKHDFKNQGHLNLRGSHFWQRIDDVTNVVNNVAENTATITPNLGYVKNKGYELDLAYHLQNLTARVGVANSDPTFYGLPDTSKTLRNFMLLTTKPGRTWTSSISYRFDKPNVEVGVRNRTAEKSNKPMNADCATTVQINCRQSYGGYSITDLFANWKPLNNDRLNVNFGVNNITNKHYYPHAHRPAGGASIPGTGRDYRIGFNYTF